MAILPRKKRPNDPDLRDRLYELLEHDHLPYSVGSRFVRLIVAVIVVDVVAAILASVPEFDARLGRLFATMKPYVAAPPPGVQSPPLWGSEQHVLGLLGDRVTDVVMQRRELPVDRFANGAAFRDYFKANYGPTIAAYRGIADHPDKAAALDADIARLGDDARAGSMSWEYLLLTAHAR